MLAYNENNRVEFVKPAEQLAEPKRLLAEYKSDPKVLQQILVYVYNVYNKKSIFYEYTIDERKERVCVELLEGNVKPEYFENNPLIKDFINAYVNNVLTVVERDHERCKKDIEDLHEHISQVPFVKKQRVKKWVMFKDEETGKEFHKEIDIIVEIDNSEEKKKALDIREKLYSLDARLRKLIETEKIERELTAKTMFET